MKEYIIIAISGWSFCILPGLNVKDSCSSMGRTLTFRADWSGFEPRPGLIKHIQCYIVLY